MVLFFRAISESMQGPEEIWFNPSCPGVNSHKGQVSSEGNAFCERSPESSSHLGTGPIVVCLPFDMLVDHLCGRSHYLPCIPLLCHTIVQFFPLKDYNWSPYFLTLRLVMRLVLADSIRYYSSVPVPSLDLKKCCVYPLALLCFRYIHEMNIPRLMLVSGDVWETCGTELSSQVQSGLANLHSTWIAWAK